METTTVINWGYEMLAIPFIIILIIAFVIIDKRRRKAAPERQGRKDVQTVLDQYGEPDELIILDPTRGNEANSVIAVYKAKGIWIIEGEPVERQAIVSATFNNAAVPYTENAYQIILNTTLDHAPLIHLSVGRDLNWAKETFEQILSALE